MKIDIRNQTPEKISQVVFSDQCEDCFNATLIVRNPENGVIYMAHDTVHITNQLVLRNKQEVENLIKALKYTIDNEWFD